jgi:hypothetical protein
MREAALSLQRRHCLVELCSTGRNICTLRMMQVVCTDDLFINRNNMFEGHNIGHYDQIDGENMGQRGGGRIPPATANAKTT